jgi:hypothetical protein
MQGTTPAYKLITETAINAAPLSSSNVASVYRIRRIWKTRLENDIDND